MTRYSLILASMVCTVAPSGMRADDAAASPVQPLANAHAHNDYHHPRPLRDALANGFCSVEADVFLVDGKLLVGHDPTELRPSRTLRKLYLEPLRVRVKRNGGRVFPHGPTFTLMIDVKSDGASTYDALADLLGEYADVLAGVRDSRPIAGAVTIVVSGNRATERIAASSPRFVGIDGRLSDLDSKVPSHLMPMISDHWGRSFRWRGDGPMPEPEREKLRSIVDRAHRAGRRVRFWATPENEAVWRVLREAGVDLINTDELERLRRFLTTEG